jgi:hypothetical protein
MLTVMAGTARFGDLKSEISDLRSRTESVCRQLGAFVRSLQNSTIDGPRYLNDAARDEAERRSRREAFEAKIASITEAARAKWRAELTPGADGLSTNAPAGVDGAMADGPADLTAPSP